MWARVDCAPFPLTHQRWFIVRGATTREGSSVILSQSYLRELKAFHRALGDVTRLRAVQILATEGELSVSELVTRLHISQPLMSWHLRRLTRAGIVKTERVGREVRCSFDRERYSDLQDRSYRALMNRA
jgi:DNA-binding transcriptional ArsR family regulator